MRVPIYAQDHVTFASASDSLNFAKKKIGFEVITRLEV